MALSAISKKPLLIVLMLALTLGIAPQALSQEASQNVVQAAAEITFSEGPRFIAADALYENLNDGDPDNDPTIISLRSSEDYAKGHLPGAVWMDVKTLFTPEGLATIPPDKQVVFVCYTGQSASQATSALNMLGYDAVALLFGMSSWTTDAEVFVKRFNPETHSHDYTIDLEAHEPGGPYEPAAPLAVTIAGTAEAAFANGPRFIQADALYENLNDGDPDNDPTIISLRSSEDYAKGHLPSAVWMDVKTLFTAEGLATIPPDKNVVVVCYTGQSASQATSVLNMLGYDATALLHGMSSWTTDAEVFVKRFNPEQHSHDYTIDLEAHEPDGPYEPPAPLVEEAFIVIEPAVTNVIATAAEITFSDGTSFIAADALYENLNDGDADNDPTVISLRSAEDYAKGHIPGAVWMDVKTLFTPEGLAAIPPDKEVVVVCYTGQSASQATSALNMLGYDAATLLHGMSSWTTDAEVFVKRFNPETHAHDYTIDLEAHETGGLFELPAPLATTVAGAAEAAFANGPRFIQADALYENLNDGDPDNDPTIISLRSSEDYAKGHLPGAVWVDVKSLFTPEGLATIPPDKQVVFVCYTGQSASQATSALNMLGYDATALLHGMSSLTTDAEVFVKRFNPETHAHDYAIDLEAHEPGGPYELPAPLVEGAPTVVEPTPTPVAEVPVTAVASNCVSCHTNRQDLELLAVEKEVTSEKTSGEG
jgi:rhodanese-related sulfurtransferase